MPELPEILNIHKQFKKEFLGRTIVGIEILQSKCLNLPEQDFKSKVLNKAITDVGYKGKWIIIKLSEGLLFFSLGMGGDFLLAKSGQEKAPEKYHIRLDFDDERSLYITFWWFGYFHYTDNEIEHSMTALLGFDPISPYFTFDAFNKMLEGKKGNIKSFLLDQHNIAGIGNVYIQDILFLAKVHPLKKINTLTDEQKFGLFEAIKNQLKKAADKQGLKFEKDLYGKNGGYEFEYVAYQKGKPCPVCNTKIVEIKTGSTRSYICPSCQK